MEIKKDIHYVGVNDRTTSLFEGLWPLPYGVSYNSYLIADEKVALIDTVESGHFDVFLKKIRQTIGDRPVDYLVINHMEPDHSGSIKLIKQFYPDIVLVGNKLTLDMVDGYYGKGGERLTVGEGDTLSLGSHTLTFSLIPMVHWPETMVTYDVTGKVLFSGDAFGCFGALNGGAVDATINTGIYWDEMVRYYSNIVGKYGPMVQRALKKLEGLQIDAICSTHGPVWTEEIPRVIGVYDRLSRYEAEDGVVIAYGSMYGNTEEMAEVIAEELNRMGVRNVVMHDVSRSHHSYIIADVFRYKGLIVGCPTYNGGIFPEMEALLNKLAAREVKGRLFGHFGSFTWAGMAVKKIAELNEKMKFETVGSPVEMKQAMKEDAEAQARELARAMAERLNR